MAHKIYENFVLENKMDDLLTTAIDMNEFITADYSLTENAGMKKIINTYTAKGNVEDLEMGEGNTQDIEVSFTSAEYKVGTTQGRTYYYDEQEMTDPYAIDRALKGLVEQMTNDLTAKAIGEFKKATMIEYGATWTFDNVVDAIAKMNLEKEDGLFMLINPAQQASFRKNLKDDLKYVEGFVRAGYIGSVCGVPIFISKAVPVGNAFLGTRDAITCFVKKGSEIEQERDANTRKNMIYSRKVMLIALTDATKLVRITATADPRTGYTVATEEPSSWASVASTYFTYDAVNDKMVAVSGIPEFVPGKFYSKNG